MTFSPGRGHWFDTVARAGGSAVGSSRSRTAQVTSGGGGIRTLERLATSSVFKTDAIGHSATPPGSVLFLRTDAASRGFTRPARTSPIYPMTEGIASRRSGAALHALDIAGTI